MPKRLRLRQVPFVTSQRAGWHPDTDYNIVFFSFFQTHSTVLKLINNQSPLNTSLILLINSKI